MTAWQPTCLVSGEFGLPSSPDETQIVGFTHHLNQAHAGIEIYIGRPC